MPSPSSPEYPAALRQELLGLLGKERHPLSMHVDGTMRTLAAYGNAGDYGLDIAVGTDLRDALPALHGLEPSEPAEIPLMHLASGNVVDLHLVPDANSDSAFVILLDSTALAKEALPPQQRANETALLNYRQEQLMAALAEAKQQAEAASRLKSDFIANFSHEFRTPLTAIMGYCNLLNRQAGEGQHADAIQRAASHLLSLVENLLDHGRTEHDRIELLNEVVDAQAMFDDVESLLVPLANQRRLDLKFDGATDCEKFLGDPVRLRQIVTNLTTNALKYTQHGQVEVKWRYRRGQLNVRITDTGPGVPTDEHEHIFQPFAQGQQADRRGGLGLGLPLARELAQSMGGTLKLVESNGEGSIFSFQAALRPALESMVGEPSSRPDSDRQRLLIVEDDPDVSTLLELMLSDVGYQCDTVISLDDLARRTDTHDYLGALVDMHLPDGSGVAAIESLAEKPRSIPVLAMSASTAEETRRAALRAGARTLVAKPFDFNDLIRRIQAL